MSHIKIMKNKKNKKNKKDNNVCNEKKISYKKFYQISNFYTPYLCI